MCYVRRIVFFAMACLSVGKDVLADEWALKGAMNQQLLYNDNISFSTTEKESVVGYLLTPTLQATRKTEVYEIGFQGQGLISRYDDSSWDCDNYNLGLNNAYLTKRNIFSLNGGYSSSCSYAQQIRQTGIVVPNSQSTNYWLSPAWNWQWTSLDQLILSTSYAKTSYSNSGSSNTTTNTNVNFSGNDTYTINLGGNHQWSRNLSLNEKLFYSNVQYTGSNASTQNMFGFQIGANYIINHYWSVSGSGGPKWVDTQQNSTIISSGQDSSLSLGYVASINLSYTGKMTNFSTGYYNSIDPSSIGQTLQNQSVFANYSYRLTEHLVLDLTGSYLNSESIGGQSTNNVSSQFKRSYFTASPGINWEFDKNWRLRGGYIFRWQDYQQDNSEPNLNVGTSDVNVVMISVNYSWDGFRSSR